MKYLDKDNNKRREIAKYFLENIKNQKIVLPKIKEYDSHNFYVFVVRTKDRDKLRKHLEKNSVGFLIHYPIPPHKQIAYKEWNHLKLPITEQIHKEILSIPISPILTKTESKKIVEVLNSY